MSEYTIAIHAAEEGGFWVEVPALPGCYSQGESLDEALSNAKEAIETHLDALKQDGKEIPKDSDLLIGRVSIAAG